ncbi:hypothetical protein NKH77_50065 [Streptomyces sp. M19]
MTGDPAEAARRLEALHGTGVDEVACLLDFPLPRSFRTTRSFRRTGNRRQTGNRPRTGTWCWTA